MTLALSPKRAIVAPAAWVKNELWRRARAVPSLDLRFAENKSLVDATTGQNLVTFTRASSGTYVGSDGLIKTATTNLLLQSEDFSTTWTRTGVLAFGSGSTVNAIAAPNGTVTADLITEDTSTGVHRVNQANLTVSAGLNTVSVYAKQGPGARSLNINANVLTGAAAFFNLGNGTVTSVTAGSAAIQPVGDGWYKCSVTGTSAGTTSTAFIQLAVGTTNSYTGDGTSGIYIWGAQLEQSSTVGEYIPTTSTINSAPRFDHNPTTGESLGLLVEEQRTNLTLRSQEFDNAAWTKTGLLAFGSGSIANATTAPDSTTTADKIVEDTSTGSHNIIEAALITYTINVAYTFSFFIKKAERQTVQILMHPNPFPGTVAQRTTVFNSNTGSFVSVGSAYTGSSIVALPNGWYRVSVSSTADATSTGNFAVSLCSDDAGTTSYTGDGTSGVFIWGAQLEAGAFPTSYIPTTTATVTRSADVASISGSNFSSWYRQDEGTVFADAVNPAVSTTIYAVSDGTTNNRIQADSGTNTRVARVVTGAVTQAINNIAYAYGTQQKFALSYVLNAINFANAGTLGTEDTTATIPTVDQLRVGANPTGVNVLSSTIRRLTYWPSRLPNSTLQEITR